jgi:hypothetical protein
VILAPLLLLGIAAAGITYVVVVGQTLQHDAFVSLRTSRCGSAGTLRLVADEPLRSVDDRRRRSRAIPSGSGHPSVDLGTVVPLRPRPTDGEAPPERRTNRR